MLSAIGNMVADAAEYMEQELDGGAEPRQGAPDAKECRWGILAAGRICHDFVLALKALPGEASVVAVGARSLESANTFADKFGIPNRHGSYAELVNDPQVDIIYVGSLHHLHVEHSLMALRAGKHVLCEKPMALNAADAALVLEEARKHDRFFLHGVWSRFLPSCDGGPLHLAARRSGLG
jgi:dihydrodiol dehydrogenase / D-xylose 1-dehydrogenase (NADP)